MPGIIEGAHFNRGMGHKFLKHISRTMINLFIIDIDGFQLSTKYEKRTAFETLVYLNKVFFFNASHSPTRFKLKLIEFFLF